MAGLKNTTIAGGYKSILRIDDNTNGITSSVLAVTDGEGAKSCMLLSDDSLEVRPQNDNSSQTVNIMNNNDDNILQVNTTSGIVRVNDGQEIANTQYAYFGVNYSDFSALSANTHYTIPFSAASGGANLLNDVDFGTGTDPDTSFTCADTDSQYASQLVPMMWLVPDNITIDDIYAIVGADAATGDAATRIHLFQYTFTSGSASALTSGSVIAHSTADTNNAGNEQAYKTTLTKDVTDIDADKVILAFFRSDSVNSDYSINITVKYHLR